MGPEMIAMLGGLRGAGGGCAGCSGGMRGLGADPPPAEKGVPWWGWALVAAGGWGLWRLGAADSGGGPRPLSGGRRRRLSGLPEEHRKEGVRLSHAAIADAKMASADASRDCGLAFNHLVDSLLATGEVRSEAVWAKMPVLRTSVDASVSGAVAAYRVHCVR